MNVTDQWMLERMQQMAANMAASLPQTGQNAEPPKTEKGDTFKDMMDKAKDQKPEAPEKTEPVQKNEKVQTEKVPVKTKDGKSVELTAEQAAMLAAGYAKLIPSPESDKVLFVTAQDENGSLLLPLKAMEENNCTFQGILVDAEAEWTMEFTPEVVKALKQLLKENNDPRPVQLLVGQLDLSTPPQLWVRRVDGCFTTLMYALEDSDSNDQETDLNGEALAGGEPLFKDVKAAPVKVGENFQLDTQQEDMDEVLADTVRYAAQAGLKEVEIMLNPQNLGSLTIKLTQSSDGILQVVFQTTTEKAANLLNQHLDNLNGLLQGVNQNEVRVEVQRGEDSQQAQQQQTNPDGHNHQQQQQQQQQEEEHSGDFLQKLRLGLFGLDDVI